MNILSIYGSHDGCVTYTKNNKIIFHTQIDRYNKFKHTTFPAKELVRTLETLDIDLFLLSNNRWHTINLWTDFISVSKKLKKTPIINYEARYHHLFHAYCSLTWNKNCKNILVCDGNGTYAKTFYEQESLYTFDGKLKHITTEANKIGFKYEKFTEKHFEHELECGKTMAWSLYDERPKAVQDTYEKEMTELIDRWQLKDDVIFTGGCAQNVLYNSILLDRFNNLFCDPFNGDFGLSLGAINLYTNNSITNKEIYLGIPQEVNTDLFLKHKIIDVESDDVAKVLLKEPIAIFQSRSEQGQRGLGNRSLLMNPIHKDAHSKLNQIKKREWFRPFACSILKEKAKEWFEMKIDESPYMMYVFKIKKEKENILKTGLSVDNKSRIQTVSKENNSNYYDLIKSFEKITDIPVLINTSLNLPGDTLVETLNDLKFLFDNSNLNYIYLPEIKKLIKKNE